MPALALAQTRPQRCGGPLFSACMLLIEFRASWPGGTSIQIHGMDADELFANTGDNTGDLDTARELLARTPHAELFLYPGKQHLFADESLADYDAEAAVPHQERVLRFLDGIA